MAFAYFQQDKHTDEAVFEYFFRKPPFKGSFAVFNGVHDVLRLIQSIHFGEEELSVIQSLLDSVKASAHFRSSGTSKSVAGFLDWLRSLDSSKISVYAFQEGSIVFGNEPLLRISGPLALVQLLESPVLNALNFATLLTTKAFRLVRTVEPESQLLEFGLRRAQGSHAAMIATKYSFAAGFDGSSNVLGCAKYGVPSRGTHAHAFVTAFHSMDELLDTAKNDALTDTLSRKQFIQLVLSIREEFKVGQAHQGELAAFTAFAMSFPDNFVALVDTYDTLISGVPNFCVVACAMLRCGMKPKGIRLDSGNLAELSCDARRVFHKYARISGCHELESVHIVASNDLDEASISDLGKFVQNPDKCETTNGRMHSINDFGIGTKLVTCSQQAALGGVFKLVQLNGSPCFKLSEEREKSTLPCAKQVYRVYYQGVVQADVMCREEDAVQYVNDNESAILGCSRIDFSRKYGVCVDRVRPMIELVWRYGEAYGTMRRIQDNEKAELISELDALHASRTHLLAQVDSMPQYVNLNSTRNQSALSSDAVFISSKLAEITQQLIGSCTPIHFLNPIHP
eukprot:CAMPEP_0182447698 /NCGR_PEP_ID=MMETSP1172-20130603/18888_1 /TAXON_ID=708627 /ORGANISM="Timspurckia oligopyrenoides, Strain CCMP3278" /LENGTH=567 /DNA_ID=CAMNT_0024644229 /DNA_START=77 /DNA_END=1780 /DNA_ORIENTATION=+